MEKRATCARTFHARDTSTGPRANPNTFFLTHHANQLTTNIAITTRLVLVLDLTLKDLTTLFESGPRIGLPGPDVRYTVAGCEMGQHRART